MLSVSMLPPPNTCDLPDFPRWRPTQVEALERALASDRRVIGILHHRAVLREYNRALLKAHDEEHDNI